MELSDVPDRGVAGRLRASRRAFPSSGRLPNLLAGDVDAISSSVHGRSCQHDRRSLCDTDKRRIVTLFPRLRWNEESPAGLLGTAINQIVRQMTQEISASSDGVKFLLYGLLFIPAYALTSYDGTK